jgi:hypothetical protein
MNYGRLRQGMASFVERPHEFTEYLQDLSCGTSWKDKILSYVPILRSWLTEDGSKKLFYRVVLRHLENNHPNGPLVIPSTDRITTIEELDNVIDGFRKYFSIDTSISTDDKNILKYFSETIRLHMATKMEYHQNRVCESLGIPFGSGESILTMPGIWLSFYYSELCLLVDSDVLQVRFYKNHIYLMPNPIFKQIMRRYWFSEIIESLSTQSDEKIIRDILVKTPFNSEDFPREVVDTLVDFILDKVFSIHVIYLEEELKDNENYLMLRKLVAFASVIERNFLCGFYKTPSSQICKFIGRDLGFLSMIDKVITDPKLGCNSFVIKAGDSYKHGTLGFKYGLKSLAGDLVKYRERELNGLNFGGVIGKKFEVSYLSQYIKKCTYRKYRVHSGLQSKKGKDNIHGYDVDLIFYDIERNYYYFVQVKYSLHKLPKYFSEQYRFFNDEDFMGKGFKQIKLFKDYCFTDDVIQKKFKSVGVKGASKENSAFLVIHNIPYLNFYESEGIVFYEWNTFRAILNGGVLFAEIDEKTVEVNVGFKGELENPRNLIDGYFEEQRFGPYFKIGYQAFRSMVCLSRIENYSLFSKML